METTNDLRYTASKTIGNRRVKVSIRLNDECKNGHEDFAITGEEYIFEGARQGGPKRWIEGSCGCIHEEIAKFFPELHAIFEPLHLSDWEGSPMHVVANGRFHLKQGDFQSAKSTIRVSDEELNYLSNFVATGDLYFSYVMEKMGLRARYQAEAARAIAKLEELTGKKFESRATRCQWPRITPEELADIQSKEKEGYSTPEAIETRRQEKIAEEAARKMAELEKERDSTIAEANNKFLVKRAILLSLGDSTLDENIIYYAHSNTISGNWNSFGTRWTPETFAALIEKMKSHGLPEGVKFELKK